MRSGRMPRARERMSQTDFGRGSALRLPGTARGSVGKKQVIGYQLTVIRSETRGLTAVCAVG